MRDYAGLIKELCEYNTEKEWFEFKVNWFEPVELGEYISAISNSVAIVGRKEGFFVWGINDKTHEVEGTVFDPDCDVQNEPLKHFLARQLSPDTNIEFYEVLIDEKRVVLLIIPAAKTVPTSFRYERFIRIGSSKENLRRYPEKESFLFEVLRHGFPTIENTPSKYQDLTFEKLFIYYGAKGLKLGKNTFKRNLELLTEDGKYNILAQLLSDNSHIPIRIAIFSGATKSDNMYSVREFGCQCLLYSLDEILRYGDVLNIIQADETNRVVERKEVPLFENEAFREAIINAFVHNAWVTLNEPMITVYSDRIEILSRGTLAPEQTMEGFFAGESIPINRKLSEIFLQLHISEKTGRGVPKITETYGKEAFDFRENAIAVTIPFRWINVMGERANKLSYEVLTEVQQGIVEEIRHNPRTTIVKMALALGFGKTTIDKGISELKKSGYIRRVGPNKNGHWVLLK